jgi:hypothetical protein
VTGPTRADLAHRAVFWDQVAEQAKARAAEVRAGLEEEARAEFVETGTAPTWRVPGLGTIPLSLTQDAVVVVDERLYLTWVLDNHPSEVEVVSRVRPAFDAVLRKTLAKDRRDVPGLRFVPGGQPKSISVRASQDAKDAAAELATQFLDASGVAA